MKRRIDAARRCSAALAAVISLGLVSCSAGAESSPSSVPSSTAAASTLPAKVPRLFVQPPTESNRGHDAIVQGTLDYVAEADCFHLELDGSYRPVVWPSGTTVLADGPTVVTADGKEFREGDIVSGAGGYKRATRKFGIAPECFASEGSDVVAVFNPNEVLHNTLVTRPLGTCRWYGEVVNGDGAGGHIATVFGFTNVSRQPCKLPTVIAVRVVGGAPVSVEQGSWFPIGEAAETVIPGDRVELVVSSTSWCDEEHIPAESMSFTFDDGATITVQLGRQRPEQVNTECEGIGWDGLGSWK